MNPCFEMGRENRFISVPEKVPGPFWPMARLASITLGRGIWRRHRGGLLAQTRLRSAGSECSIPNNGINSRTFEETHFVSSIQTAEN